VKVVLTGEGSDELLAGYGKYPRALFNWRAGSIYARAVPSAIRKAIAAATASVPGRAGRLARRSFLGVEHSPAFTFFDNFGAIPLAVQRRLLAPRFSRLMHSEDVYRPTTSYFDVPRGAGRELDRFLYADLKTYLVELLMKQDQMSMAASIESRVPFLDHRLAEFAARLPADRKLSRFTTKRILREAVSDVLPREILERPKMGFRSPSRPGCAMAGATSSATCCSIDARASAGSSRRTRWRRCWRPGRSRTPATRSGAC
jgi:asparagine synthase (glutamine-hydrolysing)